MHRALNALHSVLHLAQRVALGLRLEHPELGLDRGQALVDGLDRFGDLLLPLLQRANMIDQPQMIGQFLDRLADVAAARHYFTDLSSVLIVAR